MIQNNILKLKSKEKFETNLYTFTGMYNNLLASPNYFCRIFEKHPSKNGMGFGKKK